MDHRSARIFAGLLFFLIASCGGFRPQLQPPVTRDLKRFNNNYNKFLFEHDALLDGSIERISGGSYANEGQFPFMAVVHRMLNNGKVAQCGGTIISQRWVLTAGHCITKSPRWFFVVFGITNKNRIGYDIYIGPGAAMKTMMAFVHPDYSLNRNDIGLLYMPRDIPFSDLIQPIQLAGPKDDSILADTTMAYVAGWGSDGFNPSGTKLLKYSLMLLISKNKCHMYWRVDFRNICTKPNLGMDACQGDSGGPLFIIKNNRLLQIGIVSYGDANCPSTRPGVYTRVAAFVEWIQDMTGLEF